MYHASSIFGCFLFLLGLKNLIQGCPSGYYKSPVGNNSCIKCGNNTESVLSATSCPCKQDYYRPREDERNSSVDCHSIPSAPLNVAADHVTNTSLTLNWKKPSNPGTKQDIWFTIVCKHNVTALCNEIVYVPSKAKITTLSAKLSKLRPYQVYQFAVFAENEVTSGAGKRHGFLLSVSTKPGLPSVIRNVSAGLIGKTLIIRWGPPLFKGDKTVYYDIKCDGYTPQETFYPVITLIATSASLITCQIRAKNSVGYGHWVSTAFTLKSAGQNDKQTDSIGTLKVILAVIFSVIAIGILTTIVFILCMKRRTRYMPETVASPLQRNIYDLVTIPLEVRNVRPCSQDNEGIDEEEPFYMEIDECGFEYSIDNLGLIKVLGEGQFGIVYLATAKNISGNKGISKVAVKMLKETAREQDVYDFKLELEIMQNMKSHPHVVRFLGCNTIKGPRCIILEYLQQGSLLDVLRKSRGYDGSTMGNLHRTSLSSKQLLEFAFMIADGMNHLASLNIVHRDLACRNVLVNNKYSCKISDLGLARKLDDSGIYKRDVQAKLPVKWMAYESLFNGISTIKSDIWSFGVVLYEILTIGNTPYPEHKSKEVIELIRNGYRMTKQPHFSDELYLMMLKCWEEEPSYRPPFHELKASLRKILDEEDHNYLNLDEYKDELYVNFQLDDEVC